MNEKDYKNLDYSEKNDKNLYEKLESDNFDNSPYAGDFSSPSVKFGMSESEFNSESENNNKSFQDIEMQRLKDERLKEYRQQCEYYEYKRTRSFNRTPLILALVGLILSVFFGVGIVFSLPALILSAVRLKLKPSKTLKWALIISILTTFVCALIIFSLGYAIIVGLIEYSEMMEEAKIAVKFLIGL